MHRLGGHVLGFSDAKMTRAGDFYQESIKDTVHMLEYYGDVIAMRHFQQGAPAEAAKCSSVPIINCGDGWGEHPTQVLTDLYTIWKELGTPGRPALPVRRRHAHAHHALDRLRRRRSSTSSSTWSTRRTWRPTEEFKQELADRNVRFHEWKSTSRVHRQGRRDLHGAGGAGRLHQVARGRGGGEEGPHAGRVQGDPRDDAREGQAAARSSCTRCRAWTSCPPTWTARATPATGSRPFNGVVLRMALIALVLGRAE